MAPNAFYCNVQIKCSMFIKPFWLVLDRPTEILHISSPAALFFATLVGETLSVQIT